MFKLSSLKDIFELITAAHTAWPVIVIGVGIALPYLVALPPAAFIALGIVIVLAVALTIWQVRHRFLYLSLPEASRRAFEQLDGTIWHEAAIRMHDEASPQNTLEYMGQLLINGADGIDLFGNKPPSTLFKQIDKKLMNRSSVKENCTVLRSSDPKELPWTNLEVKRRALKQRVAYMKANDLPARQEQPPAPLVIPPAAQAATQPCEILKKMADAQDGSLMIISHLEGTAFQVGNENLLTTRNARDQAFLNEAIRDLQRKDLIELVNKSKGFELFKITAQGYTAAERSSI